MPGPNRYAWTNGPGNLAQSASFGFASGVAEEPLLRPKSRVSKSAEIPINRLASPAETADQSDSPHPPPGPFAFANVTVALMSSSSRTMLAPSRHGSASGRHPRAFVGSAGFRHFQNKMQPGFRRHANQTKFYHDQKNYQHQENLTRIKNIESEISTATSIFLLFPS